MESLPASHWLVVAQSGFFQNKNIQNALDEGHVRRNLSRNKTRLCVFADPEHSSITMMREGRELGSATKAPQQLKLRGSEPEEGIYVSGHK